MHTHQRPPRTRSRRVAVAATALAVVAPACVGTSTASATVLDGSVEAGENITVLHNIDMVAVHGYVANTTVTVTVRSSTGAQKGTASGTAVDGEDGAGIEVNHGVDGTPRPGDCWDGSVPDIVPGDVIEVTNQGDTDRVVVDDIRFTGTPRLVGTDVVVPGEAVRMDASRTPLTSAELDSGEFRSDDGKYRAVPDVVTADGTGTFEMRYEAPYSGFRNSNGLTETERRDALLRQDGHAIGYGHTDPLPLESQMIEGSGTTSGPADGCPGAPVEEPEGEEPGGEEPGGEEPGGEEPVDGEAPTVTGRSPADGAAGVAVGTNVTATFSEDVEGATTGFTLSGPNGQVGAAVSYDPATWTATLDPSGDLLAGASYTATVAGTVHDSSGNALAPHSWTFRTAAAPADTVAPTVTRQTPRPGASRVREGVNVRAVFSEQVSGVDASTMQLVDSSGTAVLATVRYNATSRTATLNPRGKLARGVTYTVQLSSAIEDGSGNDLVVPPSWSFTVRR